MKNLIAFASFNGTDTQRIELSRAACALYIKNTGHVRLSIKIGSGGSYHHEFFVGPQNTFRESLPTFTEILIEPKPEEDDPLYVLDYASYNGYPFFRG